MDPAAQAGPARSGLVNILKNVAWLLGGKGFAAICSLVYLAILVRSLGVKDFGHFSLIFATATGLVALFGFQTWQSIVRFGAPHLVEGRRDAFARLVVLNGAIDLVAAVVGCVIGGIAIYGFAGAMDLNTDYLDTAFLMIFALQFARLSTPVGVLRVLDRFDIAVTTGAIVPLSRLIAAVAIWQAGPTVERFLLAWAIIDIFAAALLWLQAWRQWHENLRLSQIRQWRRTLRENPGMPRFLGITYANSSLSAVLQQGPLLAVGGLLGTTAAGVYRIADQLAKGLSKLSKIVAQAFYPEVNRQRHAASAEDFWKLIGKLNLMVLVSGALVVLLALLLGEWLLVLIGGEDFARGAAVLVPLALAASLELASVAYEPVLHSHNRAAWSLYARLAGVVALGIGIALLTAFGPVGVGWAVVLAFLVSYAAFAIATWRVLRRERRAS